MTPETVQQNKKSLARLMRVFGVLLLVCLLAGYAAWAYGQGRHDLPPFDQEKARTLSPAKRAEYDRLLFNELPYWSAGSRRHNLYTREAEWERMAADGHELSYLTLEVISPTKGKFSPDRALTRLDELVGQNDAGAMCLYYWLAAATNDKHYQQGVTYLKRGSDLGQPECQRQLGQLMMPDAPPAWRVGLPVDEKAAYGLFVSSALKGYGGPHNLYLFFSGSNSEVAIPAAS